MLDFEEFWEGLSDQEKADFEARIGIPGGRTEQPAPEIFERNTTTSPSGLPVRLFNRDPFRTYCPRCRVDSGADDTVFFVRDPIHAPDSDFLLLAVRCDACQLDFDLAIWPADPDRTSGGTLAEEETPDTMRTLERYCHMVQVACRRWGRIYQQQRQGEQGHWGIFYPRAYVDPSATGRTAIPARCLAAARALRKTVAIHPGEGPFGRLQIGPFHCTLGLDEGDPGVVPYLLHLCAVDSSMPRTPAAQEEMYLSPVAFTPTARMLRTPNPFEVRFLSSLFFLPPELSCLSQHEYPGEPGVHVVLPLQSPVLPEC